MNDQYGVMSKILTVISKYDANVVTLNMSLPIHQQAVINFTIDTHQLHDSVHEMLDEINALPEIINVVLVSAE
ncbi:ACT domain-containing protein [Fructilactobacillus sp. Tb1]|uniref:ACT domain-containing protein n=1 Tax=Fructilactobacillus sp. Tb1 TaxID=3422304 RepID=UPI003D266085